MQIRRVCFFFLEIDNVCISLWNEKKQTITQYSRSVYVGIVNLSYPFRYQQKIFCFFFFGIKDLRYVRCETGSSENDWKILFLGLFTFCVVVYYNIC